MKKKIKISELFDKFNIDEEETIKISGIKVKSENGFEDIKGLYKTNKRDIVCIYVKDCHNNYELCGVPEHKVKTDKGWKNLKQVIENNYRVQTINGFGDLVSHRYKEKENCFDLQVNNTHSFYTNNILSHNTEMFISLVKMLNKKTLILFARIDLATQTLKRMVKANVDAGIVQGNNIDEEHKVVMATVQSAHKLNNKYDVVIVDEVHRATAEQYQDVLRAKMFKYRFGFSATPWIKDEYKNAKVKAWIGSEIYEVDPEVLMDEERIARPTIHMMPINIPRGLENYKWMGAEKHGIVENKYRNKVIARLCQELDGKILILIKKIDQGKELEKLIESAYFLFGDTDQKERQSLVKDFESSENGILIASTIFDEGIDLKSVNHVIVAGGGSSFVKTLQRVGRGTRVTEDKKEVDIYDFWDDTNPILLKHSKERSKIYEKYGFKKIIYHEDSEVKKLLL